jgi:hypothetical protein
MKAMSCNPYHTLAFLLFALMLGMTMQPASAQCPEDEIVKLLGSPPVDQPPEGFGYSVAIDGDYAVVGAYLDDTNGLSAGAAYIFRRDGSTWVQEDKLLASDGQPGDWFGHSVSITSDDDGRYALVGAPLYDNPDMPPPTGDDVGAAYAFFSNGTTWVQEGKLTHPIPYKNDQCGKSVAVSANGVIRGVVGVPNDDIQGTDSGSALAFMRIGTIWGAPSILTATPPSAPYDEFGYAVAMTNAQTVVIGARWHRSGKGTAYVFEAAPWSQTAKLMAPDGNDWEQFGSAVAIEDDTIVIGAHGHTHDVYEAGSAYVYWFHASTWSYQAELLASDREEFDHFGWSVGVYDDCAVVGSMDDDNENGDDAGSAYVFHRTGTTWTQARKLLASDGDTADGFGTSVGISGENAIIGSPSNNNENGSDAGAAYIFGTQDQASVFYYFHDREGTGEWNNCIPPDYIPFDWMCTHPPEYDVHVEGLLDGGGFGTGQCFFLSSCPPGLERTYAAGTWTAKLWIRGGDAYTLQVWLWKASSDYQCDLLSFTGGGGGVDPPPAPECTPVTISWQLPEVTLEEGETLYLEILAGDSDVISLCWDSDDCPSGLEAPLYVSDAPEEPAIQVEGMTLQLSQNPFLPGSAIRYSVPPNSDTRMEILDVAGRRVRTLLKGTRSGLNVARWDGRDAEGRNVASGIYFFRLETPGRLKTAKGILVR